MQPIEPAGTAGGGAKPGWGRSQARAGAGTFFTAAFAPQSSGENQQLII